MKLFIKAKVGAKEEYVEQLDDNHFVVAVHERPEAGRANHAILKLLADYLNTPLSQLTIVSGFTSREKVVEIQ
jgi:hypothetical protein